MRELVGQCAKCRSNVYCENGFLNGTVAEDGTLLCFPCKETPTEDNSPRESGSDG